MLTMYVMCTYQDDVWIMHCSLAVHGFLTVQMHAALNGQARASRGTPRHQNKHQPRNQLLVMKPQQ